MNRVSAGDPEREGRRAAHIEVLESFVWRGEYRVPAPEIVAALLRDAALSRQDFIPSSPAATGADAINARMGT